MKAVRELPLAGSQSVRSLSITVHANAACVYLSVLLYTSSFPALERATFCFDADPDLDTTRDAFEPFEAAGFMLLELPAEHRHAGHILPESITETLKHCSVVFERVSKVLDSDDFLDLFGLTDRPGVLHIIANGAVML